MESRAYVSNLRQKMATGAVVLAVQMHYYEWWSRALKPGIHFVEVSEGDDMCDDIVNKVRFWPYVMFLVRFYARFLVESRQMVQGLVHHHTSRSILPIRRNTRDVNGFPLPL